MIRCSGGKVSSFTEKLQLSYGNYSARVRAITPAGNGSWSDELYFSLRREEESTSKMQSRFFCFESTSVLVLGKVYLYISC